MSLKLCRLRRKSRFAQRLESRSKFGCVALGLRSDFRARGFLRLEIALTADGELSASDYAVACVQYEPAFGEIDANLAAMEARIREGQANGASVIVLPELADTGYVFRNSEELANLAAPIPEGVAAQRLIALAKELGIHIVCGLAERDGGRFYNAAMLCGPSGYIGKFRKLHLWDREKLMFEPGDLGLPVFDTTVGRIGLVICYDGWFPETFRQLALQGAELVCVPTNWVPIPGYDSTREPIASILHRAAAHSNAIYIACAARVGTERGQSFIGGSIVIGPDGHSLAGPAGHDDEAIIVTTISPRSVARSRILGERNDVLKDRRPDVYG
jgi:predicted amidohydrolase